MRTTFCHEIFWRALLAAARIPASLAVREALLMSLGLHGEEVHTCWYSLVWKKLPFRHNIDSSYTYVPVQGGGSTGATDSTPILGGCAIGMHHAALLDFFAAPLYSTGVVYIPTTCFHATCNSTCNIIASWELPLDFCMYCHLRRS